MIKACTKCGGLYATGENEPFAGTPCSCANPDHPKSSTMQDGEIQAATAAPQQSLLREPVRVDVSPQPLVVTRDGVPCPDQAAALEEFKPACSARVEQVERTTAEPRYGERSCTHCGKPIKNTPRRPNRWTHIDTASVFCEPAAPVEQSEHDSCPHWREGDSDNCVLCGDDLGPTTEVDVLSLAPNSADPSTCPGCAAGRCMVHEPIIRADATSTAREAAEEIDDYYDGLVGFNIAIKAPETVAAIIKRHYEGAR